MGRSVVGGHCSQSIAYAPLPSQRRFHESEARFKGFSGSIGSGKSAAMCHEAIRLAYLNPGRTGLVGAPTYPMLRDATLATLVEILDENAIPYDLNRGEMVLLLKDVSSRILLRSVDEFERLRGTNLAWFGIDELTYTHEDAWLRLEGRLRDPKGRRHCGFAVWTPKGYDWVYRKFISGGEGIYDVIRARPMENAHLLRAVPDFYDRLRSSYDETFYRQEVLGEYLDLRAGRVYDEFDRNVHVLPLSVDRRYPLLWALDFNVNPMSSIVAQIVGDEVRVLDEIVLQRAKTTDACEVFCSRYKRHDAGLTVYGDASGQNQRTTGSSDYELIKDYFQRSWYRSINFDVPRKNPAVRDRITMVNSKLRNGCGDVQLTVDPRCKELIRDLEEVTYKQDSIDIDKDKDPKRTHLSDALGYLIWQHCRPGGSVGERSQRLL